MSIRKYTKNDILEIYSRSTLYP